MHIFKIIHDILFFCESVVRSGGLWIVSIIAFTEALPLVGSLIPGHTFIILGGFLAKLGVFNIWAVFAVAAIGAVMGDVVGYFVGKRYGRSWLEKYGKYFFIKEAQINKSAELLNKHTGKALIAGRFSPITRAFIPFLAGSSGVKAGSFWFFDIIGGVLWAGSSVLIGYIFGASYELAAGYVSKFLLIAIVFAIFIIWAYSFLEKREHIFSRRNLWTLCINIISLIVFFRLIDDVFENSNFLSWIDVNVNLFMAQNFYPALQSLADFISFLAGSKTVAVASLVILAILFLKKRWHLIQFYIFTMFGGIASGYVLKHFIGRVRPENMLEKLTDYSFPSGHSLTAALFFGAISYLIYRSNLQSRYKHLFVYFLVILAVLVPLSRVYLRVHWFSDVLAGASFGIFWLTLSMLIFHVLGKQKERLGKMK